MAGRLTGGELLERLAADPDATVRTAVAGNAGTPDRLRTRLATDPAATVRTALAKAWRTPPAAVHRALLTDDDPTVRAAACSDDHPVPPADLHAALLDDPRTRRYVAPRAALTPELAERLARDPDQEVRAELARNPGLPGAALDLLVADHDFGVRYTLLVSPRISHDLRSRLHEEVVTGAEEGDDEWDIAATLLPLAWTGRDLAWVRTAPLEERLGLLGSAMPFLRYAVAAQARELPGPVVARLLADPDPQVQRLTARSAGSVPPEELERVVVDHGDLRKTAPGIMARPDFPTDAFVRFATSGNDRLRAAAAARPGLPAGLLRMLAADPATRVRAGAAGNPGLPLDCLAALLTDEDPDIAEEAGTSAVLPVAWMEELLTAEGLS
ncbi:hypothetical protein [Streptomyces mashuensis]|uniref:hypothetical protein n=1 Tax=Streptomyces mashuensis TaxID=33904 RepID=UPI00167DD1BF|nr:hypothetical protein [Streptomyces mashuensis]